MGSLCLLLFAFISQRTNFSNRLCSHNVVTEVDSFLFPEANATITIISLASCLLIRETSILKRALKKESFPCRIQSSGFACQRNTEIYLL